MIQAKISFLTLKRVYSLLSNTEKHKFKDLKDTYFKNILRAHLLNSFWAYCTATTGVFERSTAVFDNSLVDYVSGEVASEFRVTKGIYAVYSSFVKQRKEDKNDQIAKAILLSSFDMFKVCEGIAVLITESLIDQIDLLSFEQGEALVEYLCKVVLFNLSNTKIKKYLLADSDNPTIVAASFSLSCLMCTFIPCKVQKVKLGEYTTEGLLVRSGIKYAVDDTMVVLGKKTTRLSKYRSREVHPEVWAFYVSLFLTERFSVRHTSKSTTNLSTFRLPRSALSHTAFGHPGRAEVTNLPSLLDNIDLSSNSTSTSTKKNSRFCFPFMVFFYSFIAALTRGFTMGKIFSKSKNPHTFFSGSPREPVGVVASAVVDEVAVEYAEEVAEEYMARASTPSRAMEAKKKIKKDPRAEDIPDDLEIFFINIDEKYKDTPEKPCSSARRFGRGK